jgi:membrane-associated progesterone receptor component
MAKNDTDESVLTPMDDDAGDDLKDLAPDELESLNHWLQFFEGKYQHVGFLVSK